MTAMSAGAVGSVCMITALLRPKRDAPPVQLPDPNASPPTLPPEPEAGPPEPPLSEPTAAAAFDSPPICTAAASQPTTRANWGAQPPIVTPGRSGEYGPYDRASNPNGWLTYPDPLADVLHTIIIHHSALPLTDGPVEIQRLHQEEKGFADVGYQYMIDERGQLFEGRAIHVRSAHTYGQNYGSVGICLIGNFEIIQPSREQLALLRSLLACLLGQYPGINRMAGHRDFNTGTLCPGANLAPLLPGFARELGINYGA
jgi:hypothetical protein